ncbi:MAG: STAS domain-containing protein [Vampirovibrionales bacterium]
MMSSDKPFWHVTQVEDWYVLELSDNHIDFRNVDILKKSIQSNVDAKKNHVILNLSQVSFVDSSGLGAILYCKKALEASGGKLILSNLQTYVQNLVKLTHLDKAISIYDTASNATLDVAGQAIG